MNNRLYHCGIDVDDKNFHVAIRNANTSEIIEFKCAPNGKALKNKLIKMNLTDQDLQFCYEASYSGFSLYRELTKLGIKCAVIAPSLIPQKPGERVKTDRLDSRKLASYYAQNELTEVVIPDEEDEYVRDIIRARKTIVDQLKGIKRHLLAVCRRAGLNYREAIKNKTASHWTQQHYTWIAKAVKSHQSQHFKFNVSTLLETCNLLNRQVQQYDQQIELISQHPKYKQKVQALRCFKGLETLSSMTLISELGDIKRFSHPKKLTSYAGIDITEYSSGGKEKRFGITKQGNRHIRTTVIESCQFVFDPTKISKKLQQRREGVDLKYIEVADRCMHRLKKKSNKLLFKGKPKNKIKVACAREMLGFIWETLNLVA